MAVIAAHGAQTHGAGHMSPAKRLQVNRVGLWLFFFSESIIFGLLFTSRFFLLGTHQEHVDQFLGLVITIVLLASSVTAYTAETAMEKDKRQLAAWAFFATILLGVVFAIGVGFEWSVAEFGIKTAVEGQEPHNVVWGTVFFTMTGLHAAHVVSGVLMLVLALSMLMRGHFSKDSHWGISSTIMYWHFVDVVWVFYYPALYLVAGGGTHTG